MRAHTTGNFPPDDAYKKSSSRLPFVFIFRIHGCDRPGRYLEFVREFLSRLSSTWIYDSTRRRYVAGIEAGTVARGNENFRI